MAEVEIYEINPIPLTATVSGTPPFTVTVTYQSTSVGQIVDTFDRTSPTSVTVNVTSSTVPSGYELQASGDGSWTYTSPSSMTGVFSTPGSEYEFSFTVLVVSESGEIVGKHDPVLIVRKLGTGRPVPR